MILFLYFLLVVSFLYLRFVFLRRNRREGDIFSNTLFIQPYLLHIKNHGYHFEH